MKLAEALKITQEATPADAERYSVYLACGFEPLHLATFLAAHLRRAVPERLINIETGIYGDLPGNLEQLRNSESDTGVVIFEWADFDARLGLRGLGGWGPQILPAI